MSSPIWTPAALWSERRAHASDCWRLVEAQHQISTLKLTDTLAEQQMLEELLEETKPPLPPETRELHYLMAAPFRYGTAYPRGSRFRRAGRTPGVFYGAERPRTAAAEMAFYRLLFFAESPGTPWPENPGEFTAFNAPVRTPATLDLMSCSSRPQSRRLDSALGLRALPGSRDVRSRGRDCLDPLRIRARSGRWRQPGAFITRSIRRAFAEENRDLAHQARAIRSTGDSRISSGTI